MEPPIVLEVVHCYGKLQYACIDGDVFLVSIVGLSGHQNIVSILRHSVEV